MNKIKSEQKSPPEESAKTESPASLFERLFHYVVGSLSFATVLAVAAVIISLFDTGHHVSVGSVPKSLEEEGYSAGLIGAMLASDVQMVQTTPTPRRVKDAISGGVADAISNELDLTEIKLPGTETTIDKVVRYIRKEFGYPRKDYEIFVGKTGSGYQYLVQNYKGSIISESGSSEKDDDITCGIYQTALSITRDIEPYTYAAYAWSVKHDQAAAMEAVERNLYAGKSEESVWAHLLVGGMYRYHHDNRNALSELQAGTTLASSNTSLETDLALQLIISNQAADRPKIEGLLLDAAMSGLPEAQRALGNFYWLRAGSGGTPQSLGDLARAESWLISAVNQNDPSAMRTLARFYQVRGRYQDVVPLYEKAASLEDPPAQFILSQIQLMGRYPNAQTAGGGNPPDMQSNIAGGLYWLRRAADNREWRAELRLAQLYERFPPDDTGRALYYYRHAREDMPDTGAMFGDSNIQDLDEIDLPALTQSSVSFYIVSGRQFPYRDIDFPRLNLGDASKGADGAIDRLDKPASAEAKPAAAAAGGAGPGADKLASVDSIAPASDAKPSVSDPGSCPLPPPPLRVHKAN